MFFVLSDPACSGTRSVISANTTPGSDAPIGNFSRVTHSGSAPNLTTLQVLMFTVLTRLKV